jgi:drug/metabolite transporter superfamily protein YnfA
VDQKLHEIDRLYTLFHQGINEKRMLLLELAIVALFLFEVIATFFFRK